MPFATTWNDLDGIMPSKIINLKIKQTSEYNKKKETNSQIYKTNPYFQWGEEMGRKKIPVGD